MKFFYLILFASLLTGYDVYAQNYFPATGNVGIGTNNPYGSLNVDPQGAGGITIGNPSVNSGGFTSLQMGISSVQNGYSFLQSVQSSGLTWGNMILNKNGGNIGIGTTTPNTRLDVNGVISMNSFAYLSCLRIPANNYTNLFLGGGIKDNGDGTYTVSSDGASNFFSAIRMDNGISNMNAGAINFYDGISVSGSNYNITNANLLNYLRMTISGNGNVGVGIGNPQNKLDVNGTIHAKQVNIDLNGWSDYVFKKDYQLRPLSEVKAYIDQNQHLPETPSEQEMIKKGLDVSEMSKLHMKKIEELTLYLIEKDIEINEQKAINNKLQEQINQLNKKLELLINKIK